MTGSLNITAKAIDGYTHARTSILHSAILVKILQCVVCPICVSSYKNTGKITSQK